MKITVSSWPGAGATTLSLILADLYKLKLLAGGKVFRYIYEKLSTQNSIVDGPKLVEPYFGPIFDRFTQDLLEDNSIDNILIESDVVSLRVGKLKNVVSIFLYADSDFREKRINLDKRAHEGKVINEIDQTLQEEYKKLYGIDFLNTEEIKNTHTLPIDNTHISIGAELKIVNEYLKINFKDEYLRDLDYKLLEKLYFEKGKDYFKAKLESLDMIYSVEEILDEIKKRYSKELKNMPSQISQIISG